MSRTEYQGQLTYHLGQTYQKNMGDMLALLDRHGNQALAIRWAKRLAKNRSHPPSQANPCTTVHRLVEALQKAGGKKKHPPNSSWEE